MKLLLMIISVLYAGTGILATIGYLPTIKDLLNKKASANLNSYIVWTSLGVVTFIYTFLIIQDFLLLTMTGLILISNSIVLILALKLNKF